MAPPKQIPTCFKGPVQVIAAGLPRCATTTLKEVFENPNFLDVGPTMHMNRCLTAPANMQFIMEALREPDTQKRRAILYKLFAGCAATADFPGHLFIEDLIEMYPDAKVVLNVRKSGAQDWAASMSTTIAPFMGWQYRTACYLSQPDYWHYQCEVEWQRSVQERFGVKNFWDAEVYEKHNQWVLDVCREKGKEVLIWEPSLGWAQLCEFLGKKVPENGIPRTNDRGKMEKIVLWRISIGLKMWATKVVAPIALSVFGSWGLMRATNLRIVMTSLLPSNLAGDDDFWNEPSTMRPQMTATAADDMISGSTEHLLRSPSFKGSIYQVIARGLPGAKVHYAAMGA